MNLRLSQIAQTQSCGTILIVTIVTDSPAINKEVSSKQFLHLWICVGFDKSNMVYTQGIMELRGGTCAQRVLL